MNHIQKYENFLNLFDDKGISKVLAKNDKIVLDLIEKIKLDWESDKNPNKIEFWPLGSSKNSKCNRIVYDSIDGGRSNIIFEISDNGIWKGILGILDGRPSKFSVSIISNGDPLYTRDTKGEYPNNELAIPCEDGEGYYFHISNKLGSNLFKMFKKMKYSLEDGIEISRTSTINISEVLETLHSIEDILIDLSDDYDLNSEILLYYYQSTESTKPVTQSLSELEKYHSKDFKTKRINRQISLIIFTKKEKEVLKSGIIERLKSVDDRLLILPIGKVSAKNTIEIKAYFKDFDKPAKPYGGKRGAE
jgi:hypothetical protein